MKKIEYTAIEGKSLGFFGLLGGLGALIILGLLATWYMEHNGHWVTGMTNQIGALVGALLTFALVQTGLLKT